MSPACGICSSTLPSQADGYHWFTQVISDASGNWSYNGSMDGKISATATDQGGVNTSNTSEFSTCFDTGLPLPIVWLNLYAKNINEHTNALEWTTTTEVNNDYFVVEKSTDGYSYAAIDVLEGAGTSTSVNHYTYNDQQYQGGTVYYRIIQVDFNGESSRSNSVTLSASQVKIGIHPNPFKDELIVSIYGNTIENSVLQLTLLDVQGKEVYRINQLLKFSDKTIIVPTAYLAKGLYVAQIEYNQYVDQIKVIKE